MLFAFSSLDLKDGCESAADVPFGPVGNRKIIQECFDAWRRLLPSPDEGTSVTPTWLAQTQHRSRKKEGAGLRIGTQSAAKIILPIAGRCNPLLWRTKH